MNFNDKNQLTLNNYHKKQFHILKSFLGLFYLCLQLKKMIFKQQYQKFELGSQSAMGKLNFWTQRQDQILRTQFEKHSSRKWKNISKILKLNGYQRTEAECRQRYVNHLDPILNKNPEIQSEQLQILYRKYQQHGPKWCLIQTFVPKRTQIRIKNIFYGNIRLFLKKLYKYFTKKTAVFINNLRTDDLQNIYDGKQQFQGNFLLKKGFKKFQYMVNQQTCNEIISHNKEEFFQLLNKILQYKTKIVPLDKNNYFSESQNSQIFSNQQSKQNKLELIKEKNNFSQHQIKNQNVIIQNKLENDCIQGHRLLKPVQYMAVSCFPYSIGIRNQQLEKCIFQNKICFFSPMSNNGMANYSLMQPSSLQFYPLLPNLIQNNSGHFITNQNVYYQQNYN